MVAHVAVNGVGKVNGRGPLRHGEHFALGGENVDRVRKQIDLHVVPELAGIARFGLNVQQRLQPLGVQRLLLAALGLVQPVGSHPRLSDDVHGFGAQLKFDVHPRWANQRGVQRLVAIGFGNGNMVFEAARHGLVQLVQHPQGGVAIGGGGQDDAKAVNVGHLGKAQVVALHFLVEHKRRVFSTGQAGREANAFKRGLDLVVYPLHQVVAAGAGFGNRFFQRFIPPRVQVAKSQVLQLAVGLVQAQTVGNRSKNLQSFRRNTPPLAARHVPHGAHVVRAVGQLDENDAHILGHGQQHFAKGFGLGLFAGVEVQLVQLGQAIDQLGHRLVKLLAQIVFGDATVFHGIVQQGSGQRLRIEFPVGTDARHGNRVGNVRIAAAAPLVAVGLVGKLPSAAHHGGAVAVQIA